MGAFVPFLAPLYDYAWFVGFGVSAGVYLGLSQAL
jgi:cytosine/uracil/thiamine/allantoin permease